MVAGGAAMPWQETCVMDQRLGFIVARREGEESMAALCRHFGISRKTGHKWRARYRSGGGSGLEDPPPAPPSHTPALSHQGAAQGQGLVRGPRSGSALAGGEHDRRTVRPGRADPAAPAPAAGRPSEHAACRLLCAERRVVRPSGQARGQANKGWFQTGDGSRVEPFTLSDGHSRFLLRCEAVGRSDAAHVWPLLADAFHEYGLPRVVRSDNGPPFASLAAAGLSRLAVKLLKAGVRPERSAPGKPQQNGRHERLHLTLKQNTAGPPARSLAEQIARFERFRHVDNTERPHEALGQVPPAQVYAPSSRPFDGVLRSPDDPEQARVRRGRHCGAIRWRGEEHFLRQTP